MRPFLALSGQFFFSFLLFLGIQNERTAQSSLSPYQHSSTTITTKQTTDGRAQVCLTFLSSLSSLPHYSPTTTLPLPLVSTRSQPRRPLRPAHAMRLGCLAHSTPFFFLPIAAKKALDDSLQQTGRRLRAPSRQPPNISRAHLSTPLFLSPCCCESHSTYTHHTTLHYTVLPCIHLFRLHH